VSATNCNLEEAIAQKTFREDLYFRLNVIELAVPPLAERADDILPIAEEVLRQQGSDSGAKPGSKLAFDGPARLALRGHAWPGNVRELQNRVQRAVIIDRTATTITREALGLEVPARSSALPEANEDTPLDREAIEGALARAEGNVSRAAAELRLSRQALYRRLDRLGIVIERRTRGT
jgi:transcriptional regulator with PAS, ATPase and Fis domain